MADYSVQLGDFPSKLASSKRVLIALSKDISVDSLASSLALALALQKTGKTVSVVSEGNPLVSHSNLYGIGDVKNVVPSAGEGNFIVKLDGVVDPSGQMNTVPSLEKLDWYPEGSALNLVFHVVPGQRFEPTNVSYNHETSGFDLIFTVDADSLDELGQIYLKNAALFSKSTVVNIDNDPSNSQFGNINILDTQASSLSEMMMTILRQLNLEVDSDIASNIVAGIYAATANLTQKVSPDTFQAVASAMQAGGKLPEGGRTEEKVPEGGRTEEKVPEVSEAPAQPVVQPEVNQIQFNSQPSAISGSTSSPQASQPSADITAQPQVQQLAQDSSVLSPQSSVNTQAQAPVQAQPQVAPFAASTEPTPAQSVVETAPQSNDLYNNPFLNPGGASFGQPADSTSSLQAVAPAPTPQPAVPANDPFAAPASGPTFNFGSFGDTSQSSVVSPQSSANTSAQASVQQPQPIQPEQVDVSGILSTIQNANKKDDAVDLKQIFNVEQMPETPTTGNTTVDSAVVQPSAISHQPSANPAPQVQMQPIQDSKPQSSPEEKPAGEAVMSTNPEAEANPTPDWLVPKIFKGGSLG